MDLTTILLRPGDLPAWHVAGELKTLAGDHPILRNIGGASFLALQRIGDLESKAAAHGEIAVYLYPSSEGARRFYAHFIKDFPGTYLSGVGDRALILYQQDGPNQRETTAIRFLRHRTVVSIQGEANAAPPPARSDLTRDALISYAERFDQRLLDFED